MNTLRPIRIQNPTPPSPSTGVKQSIINSCRDPKFRKHWYTFTLDPIVPSDGVRRYEISAHLHLSASFISKTATHEALQKNAKQTYIWGAWGCLCRWHHQKVFIFYTKSSNCVLLFNPFLPLSLFRSLFLFFSPRCSVTAIKRSW